MPKKPNKIAPEVKEKMSLTGDNFSDWRQKDVEKKP